MAFLLVGLLCLTAGLPAQGQQNVENAPQAAHARSVPYIVLGLQPPAAEITNSSTDNQVTSRDKRTILDVLVRGARAANHEPGHVPDHQHEHTQHTTHDHQHQDNHESKPGDGKIRQKRGYCSRCGGQIGYGGGLGGYGGGGYGGYGGYGGGCGSNCGGGGGYGRPVYQQPIYQQPIYQGGGGGYCNTCGQPIGGGGGHGGSYSSSSAQSSSSSFGYGKK